MLIPIITNLFSLVRQMHLEELHWWYHSEEDKAVGFVAGFVYDFKGFTAEALSGLKERGDWRLRVSGKSI